MAPTTGNKLGKDEQSTNSSTITKHICNQTSTIVQPNNRHMTNQYMFQQFLKSKQIQETLSKAVLTLTHLLDMPQQSTKYILSRMSKTVLLS